MYIDLYFLSFAATWKATILYVFCQNIEKSIDLPVYFFVLKCRFIILHKTFVSFIFMANHLPGYSHIT